MSQHVWLIALIALVTIVIVFYALEKCAKFLTRNEKIPIIRQRKRSRNRGGGTPRPLDKMDTILEQHVSLKVVIKLKAVRF